MLHRDEGTFGRKLRKLNSVLAGEASARFSLLIGHVASFDCRISQLPNLDLVVDYLRWRHEDAHRNALNAHCYWALRRLGKAGPEAARRLERLSVDEKNELLFSQGGINFNDLPFWQKRGVGLYWQDVPKIGRNPLTGEQVTTTRRRIVHDLNLPMGDEYARFVRRIILMEHPSLLAEGGR